MSKWFVNKLIAERIDNKKWKESDVVYAIYNQNNRIVYIGRTQNLDKRFKQHKKKYNNHYIKELEKGNDKNLNWEIVYIQWYSLKYNLDNKLHKLKKCDNDKVKQNFSKYEYNPKFKNYYKNEYIYKNPYIQKLDIIISNTISKTLKKCITGKL